MHKVLKVKHFYLLLGICFLVACANTEAKKQDVVCEYQGWSKPVLFQDSTAVLSSPSLIVSGASVYLTGSTYPVLRPKRPNGYLIQQVGGASELYTDVPYAGAAHAVVAAADSRGIIHVLWGEPPDTIATTDRMATETTLYYSSYRNGQWSSREQVYDYPPGISWGSYVLNNFVVDDNELHIVVSNFHTFERAGTLQYISKDEQGWHVRDTKIRGGAPFLTVGPAGELLLTYLAAQLPENAKLGDSDQNSIFITVSTDDGITWKEPVLVSRSGDLPGDKPRIVPMPDGRIHVLWFKAIEADGNSQVLWHAISDDGGQTWSIPVEIGTGLGGRLIMFQAVATRDGCLHAVVERESVFLLGDQQLYYTRWNGSEWSRPERPFPQTYSLQFALTAGDDDKVHLTWTQRPKATWPSPTSAALPGPGEWPRQAYSVNRPR